jgi:hypothetical protein
MRKDPFAEERGEAWQIFLGELDGTFHHRFGHVDWAMRYREFNSSYADRTQPTGAFRGRDCLLVR